MIAKSTLGLIGALALSAGAATTVALAGWRDAPAPVPVNPVQEAAAQVAATVAPAPEHADHTSGGDCCHSGHGAEKGAHVACPMKPSPPPAAKSKCPYLAEIGQAGSATPSEKPGKGGGR